MNPEIKYSLWAAGLYFIVANPITYGIVQSLLGNVVTVSGNDGPTQIGTLIHSVVYGLLTFLLMKVGKRARGYQSL
uniref:Uncharacterized protein n=1 Tax=viral metagenome TaxID=1070528 RepID=A0A6C0BN77_9ZZZZ